MNKVKRWNAPKGATIQEVDNGEFVLAGDFDGEIAKRDARIVELEDDQTGTQSRVLSLQNQWRKLDAELAAIKAQEPVAIEFRQFMTDVVTGAGLLSCGKQSKGLAAELSANAYKYLLGAPVHEAKTQGVVMPERKTKADYGVYIDEFADEAAAIYNAALDEVAHLLSAPSPAGVDGLDVAGDILEKLSAAQAIIDGLRGEVERLQMQLAACGVVALANTTESAGEARQMHPDYMSASCSDVAGAVDREIALRTERDQHAQRIVELESKTVRGFLIIDGMAFNPTEILSQNSDLCAALDERDQQAKRIGELEGLLRRANTFFVDDSVPGVELSDEIEAALSAGKEGE